MLGPMSPIETTTERLALGSTNASMRARATGVGRAASASVRLVSGAIIVAAAFVALAAALAAQHRPPYVAAHLSRLAGVSRGGLELLPAAAQGAVSAALGADDPAYRVRSIAHGRLLAQSAAMRATFAPSGVSVSAGSVHVDLGLRALGLGGAREALAPIAPRARANEVSYAYPSVRAWYRNGPAGIEQGFVLPRAPFATRPHTGSAGLNLILSFAVSTDAQYRADRDGESVTFSHGLLPALRLGSLVVTDATGRALASGFAVVRGGLRLRVDTAGARYPITIDPLLSEGTPLTGAGEVGAGLLGVSVALSEDGSTAIVGAPRDNNSEGAAWVFVRSGSSWTQQGPKLLAGGPAGGVACSEEPVFSGLEEGECGFGTSVALAGDGSLAIVGSPRDNMYKGGAWVFTRTGTTWSREAHELSGEGELAEGHFGKSVAISADGSVVLIAGPADKNGHGAVWSFKRTGSGWDPMGEGAITPSDEIGGGYFGRGLALSPDGTSALIGAPGDNAYRGAAWLFTRSGSSWVQRTKVTGGEEQGPARFGWAVAISEAGETALVGAPRDASNVGAAWAFDRVGSELIQEGSKLVGAGEMGEGLFGRALAMSASGRIALIGAPRDGSGRGAAWVFSRSALGWSGEKFTGDWSRGQFAASVAISDDGNVPLFGEPLAERQAGVAWAGLPHPFVTAVQPASGPAAGGTNVMITGADFNEVSAVSFGGTPATAFAVRSTTSIIVLAPPGAEGSTVDITVTTTHGSSEASLADQFTYVGAEGGPPSDSGPGEGSAGGGTPAPELRVEGFGPGGSPTGGSPTGGCRLALVSSKVKVLSHGRAALRLRRLGSGRCAGKLTFTVRVKGNHGHSRTRTIGAARFAITSSTPVTVRVSLNASGRALLRAGHGQVRASLVLVRLAPLPARAQTASVRLLAGR
jgi:IPT/TIG domain/FG-GAP repeat